MVATTEKDPHCVGFRGQIYDFMGEPDKTYCFYSSKTVFQNFHLTEWSQKKTYISKVGLCILNNKIEVGLAEKSLYCLFNGNPMNREGLNETAYFPTGIEDKDGNELMGYLVCDKDNKWCNIKCGSIEIQYWWGDMLYEGVFCPHLNQNLTVTEVGVLSQGVTPHGVLGCTARYDKDPDLLFGFGPQGRGIIEGQYTDYEVSGLFETDFKYNRFGVEPDTEPLFGIGTDSKALSD